MRAIEIGDKGDLMLKNIQFHYVYCLIMMLCIVACETGQPVPEDASADAMSAPSWDKLQTEVDMLFSVDGLSGPEAVRYDPLQDVYFIANFNGSASGDSNGFITKVSAEGAIEALEFMVGTEQYPLHGPRGMFIVDDILWAADASGIHGFNRVTGAHEQFVDFSEFSPGFLNDIVQGPDDALYVTDTGEGVYRVYRVEQGAIVVALEDSLLGRPNGITFNPDTGRFITVAWEESQAFQTWEAGSSTLEPLAVSEGGNFDGVEVFGGRVLVSSQKDSTLRVVENGMSKPFIHVPGAPADIGVDTQRNRVAVPYIGLNRIDVWALPATN